MISALTLPRAVHGGGCNGQRRCNHSASRALFIAMLAASGCDRPSPDLDLGPVAEEELGNSTEFADDLISRARNHGVLSDEEVIMLGYMERLRLGLGSPFRLIDFAARDPRLSAAHRKQIARILLARTARGESYQIESAALTWIGGVRIPVWHHHVLHDAISEADDPRIAEQALQLAYEMAAAEGTVSQEAPALAASAAALLRDRDLSRRDAAAIYRAAELEGVPAADLVAEWRRERRFMVERPAMAELPSHINEAATTLATTLYTDARVQQERRRRFLPDRDDPIAHEPLLTRELALRLANLARIHNAPPQAPITTAVYVQHRRIIGSPRVSAADRLPRERFVANATNEENFAAEHALLWQQSQNDYGARALTALLAATSLRSFAQEPVWFPGSPGPSARDLEARFGLVYVRFEDDVPASWQPYYRSALLSAFDALKTVLPHVSVSGLRIRVGHDVVRTGTLATHTPRTRTLLLTPSTVAGPLAHEIAHDLDWQLGVRVYGARGRYAMDHALSTRGQLATLVRAMSTDSVAARFSADGSVQRASEVFARNVDWLVMAGLAALGTSNGYLTSAQSPALPGYGSTTAPDPTGHAGTALLAVLDRYSPPAADLRPALDRSIGRDRVFTPLELVQIATLAASRRRSIGLDTDVAADTLESAMTAGEGRIMEASRARDVALRAVDHRSCGSDWSGDRVYRSKLRALVIQAAAARARGIALEIAEIAGGPAARRLAAHRFYQISAPDEPVDAADSVLVERLVARALEVSDEPGAANATGPFSTHVPAPWALHQTVSFDAFICH